jgi:hypothetical protein
VKVLENRILRRTVGAKREEGIGGWLNTASKRLHKYY